MKSAQETYEDTVQNALHLDYTPYLAKLEERMADAVSSGFYATHIGPYTDAPALEKLSNYLTNHLNYHTTVSPYGQIMIDNKPEYGYMLYISWKIIPANTRESYKQKLD